MVKHNFGLILKRARIASNMSQLEASTIYGIEERTLRRWENGEFSPKVHDFFGLLEQVYGVTLDISFEESKKEVICTN